MKCSSCQGGLERIERAGQEVFYHCRACKLPHDPHGNPLFSSRSLAERYNPLQAARDAIKRTNGDMKPVSRTALEVALLQTVQEAYFAGIKDGVLLAYSQDCNKGEPMMEKVGVSKEELRAELQQKYNELKERKIRQEQDPLTKEASHATHYEMEAIKSKLDEIAD